MTITKHGFNMLLENELTYFAHLEGVISSVDELASAEVTKTPHSYIFRVSPSTPAYTQVLLRAILDFHSLLNLRLDLSKSIKKSSTISFTIHLD